MNLRKWQEYKIDMQCLEEKQKEAKLIALKEISEYDGNLIFLEGNKDVPFTIKRLFYIFNVPEGVERANHACRNSDFLMICLCGTVEVELDNGVQKGRFILKDRNLGLYVPRMTWIRADHFSDDAILLVLAEVEYVASSYFKNYEDFLAEVGRM